MSRPNSITLAVIIKITSSTRTTSTSGTTLMSNIVEGPPKRRPRRPSLKQKATLSAEIPLRQILELDGEVFHPRAHFLYARSKNVVEDRGRNSSSQPDRGRHEGFRNTRRNGSQARTPGIPKTLKRINDAPNGSKQPDKR